MISNEPFGLKMNVMIGTHPPANIRKKTAGIKQLISALAEEMCYF